MCWKFLQLIKWFGTSYRHTFRQTFGTSYTYPFFLKARSSLRSIKTSFESRALLLQLLASPCQLLNLLLMLRLYSRRLQLSLMLLLCQPISFLRERLHSQSASVKSVTGSPANNKSEQSLALCWITAPSNWCSRTCSLHLMCLDSV